MLRLIEKSFKAFITKQSKNFNQTTWAYVKQRYGFSSDLIKDLNAFGITDGNMGFLAAPIPNK